jgi:hypothetical protein
MVQPEVITEEVIKEVPVEIVKEVPVIKEVEKTIVEVVEVEKEVIRWRPYPQVFKEFDSVEQFKQWYKSQGFKTIFPSGAYKVDCDDYAVRLQREALRQGYLISIALIRNGYYYGVKVGEGNHAGNLVLIDCVFYYVEPDPKDFEIVKVVNRD